jgi:hypothetical protein
MLSFRLQYVALPTEIQLLYGRPAEDLRLLRLPEAGLLPERRPELGLFPDLLAALSVGPELVTLLRQSASRSGCPWCSCHGAWRANAFGHGFPEPTVSHAA